MIAVAVWLAFAGSVAAAAVVTAGSPSSLHQEVRATTIPGLSQVKQKIYATCSDW